MVRMSTYCCFSAAVFSTALLWPSRPCWLAAAFAEANMLEILGGRIDCGIGGGGPTGCTPVFGGVADGIRPAWRSWSSSDNGF